MPSFKRLKSEVELQNYTRAWKINVETFRIKTF